MALPPPHLGFNTSLYRTITPKAVGILEHAIWLKTIGQTNAARSLLDEELKTFSKTAIVIIERADLELEAGNWGVCWRLLDAALCDLRDRNADLDLPENRLMSLTWVMVGIRHRGQIVAAIQELERTRVWLWNVPVAEYTDIQTSCVRRYVIACLLVRLSSSYAIPDAEGIPMPIQNNNSTRAPWAGLQDLWQRLLDSRLLNEANSMLRVVVNRTDIPARDILFEKMLKAIDDHSVDSGKHFMEFSVRLQWSETYILLHNIPRAIEEANISRAVFDEFCGEFGISDPAAVPQNLSLKFHELSFEKDLSRKLQLAESLIESMEIYESAKKGSCIEMAADTAFSLCQQTGDEKYLVRYFELYHRLQEYDERQSEDLCDLILHRNTLIYFTSSNLVDRQKSLEWIDGFFEKHAHFESPNELQSLHTSRAILLRGLIRVPEAEEAQRVADSYGTAGLGLGKYLNTSQTVAQGLDSTEYESEDEEGEPFFTPWARVIGSNEETSEMIVSSILGWASEDIASGHLNIGEFRDMLSLPEYNVKDTSLLEEDEYLSKIKAIPYLELFTYNFFPLDHFDTTHKKRCDLVCSWLSKSVKGQRNKRLFCSILLRSVRQYHFSDKHLWALRISELHSLLTLHEKVPRIVQWTSRSMASNWLGALALTYQAQLQDARDFDEMDTLFLQAEKYNKQALEALRLTNEPIQIAIQQRLGAILSLFKIQWLKKLLEIAVQDNLQPPAINMEEMRNEIAARRKSGLEMIEETDKIFTASELQASWLSGLQGMAERQTLSRLHNNFWSIETAIQLLMYGVDAPSQDDIKAIWRWVQKYKARSLSRTIGMHNDDPPGLVNLILASPEARDMYNQMSDLKNQIEKADKMARFPLRQQMDALGKKMRGNDLLSQLINLREGTPLDISDIDAISLQAKGPIVLVDWFVLSNYPEGTGGRVLMLTARAGSAPTIDILTTKLDEIVDWQKQYLDPFKSSGPRLLATLSATDFSKSLGSLVTPLAHRTRRGDVLVFCPSNTLYRLPLHALGITEKIDSDEVLHILIQRNPIVYIHSLSLLRSCISASGQMRNELVEMNPRFASGIPKDDDYETGRSSIRALSKRFDVQPLIDETVSKAIFIEKALNSRLLHLQTHCGWDSTDPLNHFLEFPRPQSSDVEAPTSDWQLTAREVFDISLIPGTHTNLIACQGGLTEVKQGDEVMGLVPALLYSGASSTISTLWSIGDGYGAQFSTAFFESFTKQSARIKKRGLSSLKDLENVLGDKSAASAVGFVDTARALQYAVVSMDIYREPLYTWAGFVQHGFWKFPLCKADIDRI